ncbi:MAG: hypothetical protein JSV96_10300 [Candidatus Aminicenantes bacterium]|nr:MAG: hypothetical protein JSV96_10300 [Candidatus Aminicenantes bacterium]
MGFRTIKIHAIFFMVFVLITTSYADRRKAVYRLGVELERQAAYLAQSSYEHFKGWNGEISDQEQAILFKSEAFAASCRLFLKIAEDRSRYFREGYLRTNLYNAFIYLTRSFNDLEEEMRRGSVMPYSLSNCREILENMEYEFSGWPAADNLAYLHQRYVKARDASVYMIERRGIGVYVRRPFKNLESLYRFNYDLNREKDPWKYLVKVSYDTLEKMEKGPMIDLTFEGYIIIQLGRPRGSPVYLIEEGKKRGLASIQVLRRLGGWDNVFDVPVEVIKKYPDGEVLR